MSSSAQQPGHHAAAGSNQTSAAAGLSTTSEDGARSQLSQAGQPLGDGSSTSTAAAAAAAASAGGVAAGAAAPSAAGFHPHPPAAAAALLPEDALPPPELVAAQDDTIEAAESNADSDEFEPSEWGEDGGASTASTSINSSIYMHTYENGRRYHSYKNGRYPIPNDDQEQNREDMKHVMMLEMTDGKFVYAPISDHPQKIIDIGTGTGESVLPLPKSWQRMANPSGCLPPRSAGQWAIEGSSAILQPMSAVFLFLFLFLFFFFFAFSGVTSGY